MALNILLIEDDPQFRRALLTPLRLEGHEVVVATHVAQAREHIEHPTIEFHLALLDLGLPDGNGEQLLDALMRARLPVIVISAEHREDARIRLLDRGADDYLVKPFSVPELRARIRVAIRRRQGQLQGPVRLELGELVIDTREHAVWRRGERVHLTPTEFKLLERLVREPGSVVHRKQLLIDVWGAENAEQTHYLRLYIAQLRAKLEDNPADPIFLINEPGVGYKFCVPANASVSGVPLQS